MPQHHWIFFNIPEHVWKCLNKLFWHSNLPKTLTNTWRNFHSTGTQQLRWFVAYKKLTILSLNFQQIDVSAEVHKVIIFTIYSTVFFTPGGGVDDVLLRLSLIEQIIKYANLMCISLSAKHPQIFWELWMSLLNIFRTSSNMYTYP